MLENFRAGQLFGIFHHIAHRRFAMADQISFHSAAQQVAMIGDKSFHAGFDKALDDLAS